MSRLNFLPLLFFFATAVQGLTSYEDVQEFVIKNSNWKIYKLENLSRRDNWNGTSYILDETDEDNPSALELYIDFESPLNFFTHYRLISSQFEQNRYESAGGQASGKFYNSSHYLSLLPKTTSIFFPGNVPGSFTIEFWLYPYQTFDNQYIIRYTGQNLADERDRSTYGFSALILGKKIRYNFENFFWSISGEPYSIEISESENIVPYKWEHHAISYNINTGKITTYKNGIEQEVKWVTTDGSMRSPICNPLVKEEMSTPFLIGRNAFFSLDELKITRSAVSDFPVNRYENHPGVLITDIYKISDNLASLRKLQFDCGEEGFSYFKFAYRISDRYFMPDDPQKEWIYVKNGITQFPEGFGSGKYIQFKIEAYPYENILTPLTINGIRMSYVVDHTPSAPILMSAVPGDEQVELTWMPSTEEDVAGYEIYYGNRERMYICDHAVEGESPVYVSFVLQGELKPTGYTLHGLHNETPYFISIRSVDHNGNRSEYSREIYVRPSSIYNSQGYSIDR